MPRSVEISGGNTQTKCEDVSLRPICKAKPKAKAWGAPPPLSGKKKDAPQMQEGHEMK